MDLGSTTRVKGIIRFEEYCLGYLLSLACLVAVASGLERRMKERKKERKKRQIVMHNRKYSVLESFHSTAGGFVFVCRLIWNSGLSMQSLYVSQLTL